MFLMDKIAFPSVACLLSLVTLLSDLAFGGTIVTRPGISDEECSRVCLNERSIDCRYYKFDREKATCILSTDRDPTIADLRKADKPDAGPVKKPASSWISQLQARILALEQRNIDNKNLHRAITDLRAEVTAMKNSRALTHHLLRTTKEQTDQNIAAIDEKTQVLKAESKRVEDAVMTLGELQKTFGGKLRKVNEAQKGNDLTMAMLSQSSKDIRSSLRELATTTTELKDGMANVRKSVTELEVRFAGLSTDVMDKIASVDAMVGPELKEMRDSQTTLAQALSMLTKKIMELAPKIPALQKKIGKKEGVLSSINEKLRDFRKQISFFNERLSFAERQMKKAIDPASKLNFERRQLMIRLQGQLASLQDTQKRIQADVLAEISDRTHLYKDLASLKVSRSAIVNKVISLESSIRDFRRTLRKLVVEGPRGKLVTNILNRQVAALRSLKALKSAQDDVQTALEKYKLSMLRTHKQLLERDRRRMINELAMRKMQARLVSVYRKLRWSMAHNVENGPVSFLIRRQKDTLLMMARMQRIQEDLRRDVKAYKIGVALAKKKFLMQQLQHKKDLREINKIKRKTFQLYKLLRAKMENIEAYSGHDSLKHLKDIVRTQNAVINSLANYKANLLQTQLEVETQRKRQQYETENGILLHKELDRLRRRLALMLRRIPYNPLRYRSDGLRDPYYPTATVGDSLSNLRAYRDALDQQIMALREFPENYQTMRILNERRKALRDQFTRSLEDHAHLAKQRDDIERASNNLATMRVLDDQHRALRDKLDDVNQQKRALDQATNNLATMRVLDSHHNALKNKLDDISDAHDYLNRNRHVWNLANNNLYTLKRLKDQHRELRNRLDDASVAHRYLDTHKRVLDQATNNWATMRALNQHHRAVRDKVYGIQDAQDYLDRRRPIWDQGYGDLATMRALRDHHRAVGDTINDVHDFHGRLLDQANNNLYTLKRLKDQHRELRNRLDDASVAHRYLDTHKRVLDQAANNWATMRALNQHHRAVRDKVYGIQDAQDYLDRRRPIWDQGYGDLATIRALRDHHRAVGDTINDVHDFHGRLLDQIHDNLATTRALGDHHRALRNRLYDIRDAHDYLDTHGRAIGQIARHVDTLRALDNHDRAIRNHLYGLRPYPLYLDPHARAIAEASDNLKSIRAINHYNRAVRDRLSDVRAAHDDVNRRQRILQRIANHLNTQRTLDDHQQAMRDQLDDIARTHASLHLHRQALDGYKARADFDALNHATQSFLENQREVNELRRRLRQLQY